MRKRFEVIKDHFEKEAAVFDSFFFKVMPDYEEMLQALTDALPFRRKDRLKIIDLGCGTGNLSRKIIKTYPNARVICLDMAENMIKMAKAKLKEGPNVSYWQGDIQKFSYGTNYNAILSSMVLHHIEGKDKPGFYRKLYKALSKGGVFFNIDILLASNRHLQTMYQDKWKDFMKKSGLPKHKVNDMLARHAREDRPVSFEEEMAIMQKTGFKCVDVVMKKYNFTLYGGIK